MKQDQLYSLVQSLDKAEKRYFRLHQNLYKDSEQGSSMQLFQALEKESEYDEPAFTAKHRGKKFTKHFRAEKQQLQELLLASLTRMQAEKKLTLQLRMRISAGELLAEKEQVDLARRLLLKARQAAVDANCFQIALDALVIEMRLYSTPDLNAGLRALHAEQDRLLGLLREESRYEALIIDFMDITSRIAGLSNPEIRSRLEALRNDPALQDEKNARSLKAKVMFHYFWANYYLVLPDAERRFGHFLRQFEVCAQHFPFAKAYVQEVVHITFNVITGAYNFRRAAPIEEASRFIREFQPSLRKSASRGMQRQFEAMELLADLYVRLLRADFAGVAAQHKRTLEMAASLEAGRPMFGALLFSLAIGQFAVKEYRACIRTLHLYLTDTPETYTDDLKRHAGFYHHLLCHYELGNLDVVEQQAGNRLRQLRREPRSSEAQLLILDFFVRMARSGNRKLFAREARVLLEKLDALTDPLDQLLLKFIGSFRVALDALRTGKDFAEMWLKRP